MRVTINSESLLESLSLYKTGYSTFGFLLDSASGLGHFSTLIGSHLRPSDLPIPTFVQQHMCRKIQVKSSGGAKDYITYDLLAVFQHRRGRLTPGKSASFVWRLCTSTHKTYKIEHLVTNFSVYMAAGTLVCTIFLGYSLPLYKQQDHIKLSKGQPHPSKKPASRGNYSQGTCRQKARSIYIPNEQI